MKMHPGSAVGVERALGDIEFQYVDFRYPMAAGMALRDITFSVPHGTRVGIIGSDGAGQHTLARLITRVVEPAAGTVHLDRIDIRQYSAESLERQFSVIDPEPTIVAASVAANIALDRAYASREEVMDAARRAGVHEFVATLPGGYETPIGANGVRLSSLRRQQVAIARALLKDPAIVIYEDLTDTGLELQQGIEALARGRTFFTIAHHISTLERCELVLVLNEGRLTAVDGKPWSPKPTALPCGPRLVPQKR